MAPDQYSQVRYYALVKLHFESPACPLTQYGWPGSISALKSSRRGPYLQIYQARITLSLWCRPITKSIPGFRDINLARVRRAEQYLVQCDDVFVVANINRVVTDQSVKKFVQSSLYPKQGISKNICVVCTHADVSSFRLQAFIIDDVVR